MGDNYEAEDEEQPSVFILFAHGPTKPCMSLRKVSSLFFHSVNTLSRCYGAGSISDQDISRQH